MGIIAAIALIIGVFTGLIFAHGAPAELATLAAENGYFTTQALQLLLIIAVLSQAHRIRIGGVETHQRETRIATLDFITKVWGYYDGSRVALERKFPKSVVTLEELSPADMEKVDVMLNTMNIVAAGIHNDALDRSVIVDLYGRHYKSVNRKYAEYIASRTGIARSDPWPHTTRFLKELKAQPKA
jgi:hypothetical protein